MLSAIKVRMQQPPLAVFMCLFLSLPAHNPEQLAVVTFNPEQSLFYPRLQGCVALSHCYSCSRHPLAKVLLLQCLLEREYDYHLQSLPIWKPYKKHIVALAFALLLSATLLVMEEQRRSVSTGFLWPKQLRAI